MFHPHGLQPGDVFAGDFRIERALAMGGMGAVYVVEQLSTGRKRALKLLLPSLITNERSRERFEQEARVGSLIQSDHVVEVVAAGVDAQTGAPWLAMELLEGETLAERVARGGPMSAAEVLVVMRQLCHALGAAHARHVVHRDIKPENLYLAAARREGVPFTLKILDFGIAKLTEDVRQGSSTGAIGSPLWMAPEQASTAGVGPPADVWALGLVAFFCLTGRSYWKSASGGEATLQGLLKEVMFDPLEPASGRAAELGVAALVPPGFDAWFSRSLVREPVQRYRDAAESLGALESALASPSAAAFAVTPQTSFVPLEAERPAGGKGLVWVLVALGVFLLLGVAVVGIAGLGFGFYFVRSASIPTATPSPASTPVATTAAEAEPGASPAPPDPKKPASAPLVAGKTAASATGLPDASAAPAPSSNVVSMKDVSDYPTRDYKLDWYKQKITQCWKGNEGAKPDAGSYSVTITAKLNELGQASTIIVSPRPHPHFAGCAVIRTSEHPWGKGPPETKSFAFSF